MDNMTNNESKFLYALAERAMGITLANALGLMEDAKRFLVPATSYNLQTPEGLLNFARSLPAVREFLEKGQKIQAIKEVRTRGLEIEGGRTEGGYLYVGLLQAKNAVDALSKEWGHY